VETASSYVRGPKGGRVTGPRKDPRRGFPKGALPLVLKQAASELDKEAASEA